MISTIVAHDADVSLCVPVFSSYHFYCHHFCCKLCFALRHPGIDCDVFVPIDVILCHVQLFTYEQGKLGCLCCTLTIIVGIWSRFDVFVPAYLTICHGHTHTHIYFYTDIHIYTCKANCVALIAICTLVRGRLWTKDAVLFW